MSTEGWPGPMAPSPQPPPPDHHPVWRSLLTSPLRRWRMGRNERTGPHRTLSRRGRPPKRWC